MREACEVQTRQKTRRATIVRELDNGGQEERQKSKEWRTTKDLISIKESLEKKGVDQRFTTELSKVIARVSHAPHDDYTQSIVERLENVEAHYFCPRCSLIAYNDIDFWFTDHAQSRCS